MNLLDIFEGREPYQQAIDRLEQRRIEDLEAKMDDLARRGDKEGFQKCKAERDSYHKVKMDEGSMKQWLWNEAERMDRDAFVANAAEYGMSDEEAAEWWDSINGVDEASIGQDIVNKSEKMARATPPTRAGAVASTVKNAAKWLAGKGGPGREGPTYEGEYGDYSAGATNPNGTASAQRQADRERDRLEYERKQKGSKEGVAIAEKLKGLPSKKLGSARDLGKSVRKFRAQRGLEEAGTDSQWSKESDWKQIPKAKSGKPVDPRGEVTHLSDVARRKAEMQSQVKADIAADRIQKKIQSVMQDRAQKKNPEEVAEEGSRPRDLAAAVMLKKARAAFPIAQDDAEALALYIADKEQRDVNRLERENDEEDALIARIMDQLKKTEVDEASWGGSGPAGLKTPYAVYTKQNGQVKRVKTTNKIGQPMNTREAEAYVAAMRKSDPARWTHDTVWVGPADHDLDEAASPAQQAAIAISMKRAGKKPKTDEALRDLWKEKYFGPGEVVQKVFKVKADNGKSYNIKAETEQQAKETLQKHAPDANILSIKFVSNIMDEECMFSPLDENLRDWFGKEKWVRMDTKGNIKGACARGSETEGKPKCLPQAKAHALGKKGRASAAQKKRREDPNPERRGKAINVATRVKEDDLDEACWKGYRKDGMKTMFGKRYPNCVKNKNESLEVYVNRGECPGCGGVMVAEDQINEKQDACYHKVKSRYKVWPSAYASGALVQCRKKGAANWGNKSESVDESYTGVMESQGITDAKLLEVARRIDLFAKELK